MKKTIAGIFIGAIALLATMPVHAVKAYPGVVDYQQADGTVVRIKLHGDERFHYVTTPDDYLLLLNDTGIFEYAVESKNSEPVLSGVSALKPLEYVVGSPVKGVKFAENRLSASPVKYSKNTDTRGTRSLGTPLYRYSSSVFPTTGAPHSLVILVEYQDYRFRMEDPAEYYEDFLNGENFTRDGGWGSCRQYYIENSNGLFQPTFDVYGPVLLRNSRRYYGAGYETRAYEMVVEAVEALDDYVDFSQYDHNDDGYVDSVYIIYADQGENDGGPAEAVWPYSWELEEQGVRLVADGVKFNTYGCSNEIDGKKRIAGIGTFTHEFGHVLGLPDLYNTNNSFDPITPGDWSLMDGGSYNNDCRTPCNLSSFERYSLGWISPKEIYRSGDYELNPLAERNEAYKITSLENEDEFFLLEYRLKDGWDSYLANKGMLVWRIEFDQKVWDANSVNNYKIHQYVELLRADNDTKSSTDDADPFPGILNITELSVDTEPPLRTWKGEALNITSIYEIKEEKGKITFKSRATADLTPSGVNITAPEQDFSLIGDTLYSGKGRSLVYDLTGRAVGSVDEDNPLRLEKGIYIVAGKKLLVK